MKGFIIVAHGSREPDVESCVTRIVEEFKSRLGTPYVETAYLMSTKNRIEVGLKRLIHLGVSEVLVVPFFLFDGIHMKQTIPDELDRLAAMHPNITIKLGRSLCADLRMVDILVARVNEW